MSSVSFESLGIDSKWMDFPDLAECFSGRLLLVSSGRCVWEDLEKAGVIKEQINQHKYPYDVMCVNDMIQFFPGYIKHAYSNDHISLPYWVAARRTKFVRNYGPISHCHTNKTAPAKLKCSIWPFPGHGSSGLNAIYVALALGYDDIRLCGIPLDDSGHFFDAPWVRSNFTNEVSQRQGGPKYWGSANNRIFKGRVTSYSGRTLALLGEPSEN